MTSKIKILIAFSIAFSSCNYKIVTIIDDKGDKHLIREYKDTENQEAYDIKKVFRENYHPKTYAKYQGNIQLGNIDNFPYVKFDSVKVILSPDARKYKDILLSGILSSKIIYCYEDSLCRPLSSRYNDAEKSLEHFDFVDRDIFLIGLIEEPEYLKLSPKRRRFKLWINTSFSSSGYRVYFIELTNRQVKSYVDIAEFVKGASLTFIFSPWVIY